MKPFLRILLASALVLLAGASGARAAAVLQISGVSAAPAAVVPGQSATFTVTFDNISVAPTGANSTLNDFNGGTVDIAITLTSASADPIFLGSQSTFLPAIGAKGSGNAAVGFQIPTKYSQASGYFITAEASFSPTGTQQTGTATLSGSVSGINVTSFGNDYSSAPTVSITGGGGSGATARAIVTGGAVIAVDIVTAGSGYSSAPTISLSGGGGSGAAAASTISASVASIASSAGSNYGSTPRVYLSGGGGGNYATASTGLAGGSVSSFGITNYGAGYTSAPLVAISAPSGPGTTATATAAINAAITSAILGAGGLDYTTPVVNLTGGGGSGAVITPTVSASRVTVVNVTAGGSNYTAPPTVTFNGGGGAGATATAVLTSGVVTSIIVTNRGTTAYTTAPTVAFTNATGDTTGTGAAATAVLGGPISGFTITAGGTGFTSVPSATITDGSGTGSGATMSVAISGSLSSITINPGGAGSGYTSSPSVTISGGGGTAGAAVANISSLTAGIVVTNGGSNYTVTPSVIVSGGGPIFSGNGTLGLSSFTTPGAAFNISGKPDFVITGVNYAANVAYKGGDVIPMSLTFTNQQTSNGAQNVPFRPGFGGPAYFSVQVVISSNPVYGDADDFLLTTLNVSQKIDADTGTHTLSWNQLLPGNFAGSYYVLAKIDSQNQVDETVESGGSQNGNNIWLDAAATHIALQGTTFPTMYLASVSTSNTTGNGYSDNPSLSADGRYTVFASDASNLVTASARGGADTNNVRDIFIYDNQTNTTRRLNLSQQATQANASSNNPSISPNGRYVAFASDATNLILTDNNGFSDIFVVDAITGEISLESVATNPSAGVLGTQANGSSFKPSLSDDGTYLVFESSATNLVAGGTPVGVTNIYLRDRTNGITTLISRASGTAAGVANGAAGNGNSTQAVISANGKYVAYASLASNLVLGDTNGLRDVFLRDVVGNITTRISVGPGGAQSISAPAGGDSRAPSISSDGRYIAFSSEATNLVVGDTNNMTDIFVYDRGTSVIAPSTSRVSVSSSGTEAFDPSGSPFLLGSINPNISATGRFVTFASMASNLAPGDYVGRYGTLAAAILGGSNNVAAVNITNPGTASGSAYYTSAPAVTISGGGGSGAIVTAILSNGSSGNIIGFTVNNGGSGYTSVPTVSISGTFNGALNIFVADRDVSASGVLGTTGNIATSLVSVNKFGYQTAGFSAGVQASAAADIYPVISADGRWVAMPSDAEGSIGLATTTTNLLSNDSNSARDVFLHDRQTNSLPATSSPPTVKIDSPGNGSTLLVNVPVTILASATSALVNGTRVGKVASVQFYVDDKSVGTSTTFPYTASWTPTAVGTYKLSALVTDTFGSQAQSANVSVTINAAPSIGLTSPTTGTSVTVNTAVSVTASASATTPGATITSVSFYANGILLGNDTTSPYGVTWTPAVTGTYTITAVAFDSNGTSSTSPAATVTVTTPGGSGGGGGSGSAPPVVAFSPAPPTTASVNARVTLNATATAAAGLTITNVQFLVNGAVIGSSATAPYSVVWTPLALGTYSITAVATDNTGAFTTSTVATVNVNATLAVVLTTPAAGATISVNTPQTVVATASFTSGTVTSVQFFANGTSIGTASSFPYIVSWTPTTPGTYSLTATATDNTGATATSAANVITVATGTAASVAISSPAQSATIPAGLPQVIVANASAGTGTIINVQFFANGVSIGNAPAFPYNFTWIPPGPGPVALTAVVTDSLGNQTTSTAVNVTVSAFSPGAPSVSITAPSAGASLPIGTLATITAAASDADGTINNVKFYANGVLIDSDTTYPYSVSFTPVATGNYSLTAVAMDDGGNTTVSTPVLVTVSGGTAPSVAIIAPVSGSTFDLNTSQTILATASSTSGTIVGVQFFVNGTSIGTTTTFPFATTWKPTAVGTYSLMARATDSFGNFTDSAPVLATVTPGSPTLPKVALTSGLTGTSVTINTPVFLSANAVDPDGVVTNVEFYVNDKLVGSKAASPYFAAWLPTTIGTFAVKAIVTDNAGNRVTSAPSTITTTPQNGALPVTDLDFNNPAVDSPTGATPPTVDPLIPVKVAYGSKLIISAAAVKDDGTITNVQFFANGVNIGTLTAAPYFTTYQLNTLSDVTLTALVSDSAGNNVFTNPILISTQASTQAAGSVVTLVSPTNGATYVTGGQITFSATHNFGNVTPPKIDFYIDGQQFTTVTTATGSGANAPYQYIVGLTRAGTYTVHAVGRQGNVTTVSAPARIVVTSSRAPAVSITNPTPGPSYTVGTSLTISANASSPTGLISSVQFFVNGAAFSTKNTVPYTAAWNPGAAGVYTLTALATDDSGNQTLSAPVILNLVANSAPTVSVSNPANGTRVSAGTVVNLTASAADSDGTVTSVRFLANGNSVGNAATAAPFTATWTPSAAGSYSVVAQATDNSGNVTTSAPITVVVGANVSPVVTLTSPGSGATVRTGSPTTLVANASDADGLVASVQFFANGTAVAAPVTTVNPQGGYRTPWTPSAEGIYRLTAVVTDNAGATTTSATTVVLAANSSTSASDTVYAGSYSGGSESGRFAVISVRGKSAAFIAYSTTTPAKTYFYSGLSVDSSGGFSLGDSTGRSMIAGNVNDTGVSGTLDGNRILFIGPIAFPSGSGANGYYTGNITGRPNSMLAAIVGADGSIMAYVSDGSFQTVGSGSVDSTGSFNVSVTGGARLTGKIDPTTGFLTGSLSGANGGAVMATTSSGVSFSDGFLRNLSTRGQVGTGGDILIAGFVVGGSAPKQVLVRAIGPTLSSFGVTGVLADPQLQLFNSGGALVVSNNNWGGAGDVINASIAVGAFPLASNSLDAVILATLSPGAYTAQVSGVGSTTGLALVELYDVDSLQPFSTQKVMNVATRGVVGTGQAQLIAGFVVSGNTAKKVLIRGVGPTLAAAPFNVAGVLADPVLRLVRSDNLIIRENDNWETGNDVALLNDAATKVGAFPLAIGGKDSAILLNLPPGTYSAQVTGSGNTTGVALIEVYEVP